MGVAASVLVNTGIDRFGVIDYRIYDPDRDGRSKLYHRLLMWEVTLAQHLPFSVVLMDSWYTTMKIMKAIEAAHKIYYGAVEANWQVSTSRQSPYCRDDELAWSEEEKQASKRIHLKRFPADHIVNLFRVVLSSRRTDFVVTNDQLLFMCKQMEANCPTPCCRLHSYPVPTLKHGKRFAASSLYASYAIGTCSTQRISCTSFLQ